MTVDQQYITSRRWMPFINKSKETIPAYGVIALDPIPMIRLVPRWARAYEGFEDEAVNLE